MPPLKAVMIPVTPLQAKIARSFGCTKTNKAALSESCGDLKRLKRRLKKTCVDLER